MYLIDYNVERNLPAWSNRENDAILFETWVEALHIQAFLKQQHGITYALEYKRERESDIRKSISR